MTCVLVELEATLPELYINLVCRYQRLLVWYLLLFTLCKFFKKIFNAKKTVYTSVYTWLVAFLVVGGCKMTKVKYCNIGNSQS